MIKTNEELKKLAIDVIDGKIYTCMHAGSQQLKTVFMPIGLGALSNYSSEKIDDIALIYEYMEKAGPISCNGKPTFMSFKYLTKAEFKIFRNHLQKYLKIKKEFMDGI